MLRFSPESDLRGLAVGPRHATPWPRLGVHGPHHPFGRRVFFSQPTKSRGACLQGAPVSQFS